MDMVGQRVSVCEVCVSKLQKEPHEGNDMILCMDVIEATSGAQE